MVPLLPAWADIFLTGPESRSSQRNPTSKPKPRAHFSGHRRLARKQVGYGAARHAGFLYGIIAVAEGLGKACRCAGCAWPADECSGDN